jgi:hypothetical protein
MVLGKAKNFTALQPTVVNRISAVAACIWLPQVGITTAELDLVRFTDIEASAEWSADRYDPDFE